jgi:hypothetical protein
MADDNGAERPLSIGGNGRQGEERSHAASLAHFRAQRARESSR